MLKIGAGDLDRRITIQRASVVKNGFGESVETWSDLVSVWAQFRAVSDGEKWRAGLVESREIARFIVRWSTTLAGVTSKDRLTFDGRSWGITGIKEVGDRRRWLEITAEIAA